MTIKILYFTQHEKDCDRCHNELCSWWSIEFCRKYYEKTGHWINPHSQNDMTCGIFDNWEIRCDCDAIALVEEYGGDWASGNEHQTVKIQEFPSFIGTDWTVQFANDDNRGNQKIVPVLSVVCMKTIKQFFLDSDLDALHDKYHELVEFL